MSQLSSMHDKLLLIASHPGVKLGIFVWGDQVTTLIYLLRQPPSPHTYIHTRFYLINYIYTHTQQQKKKCLIFSIKILFDVDFS